MFLFYYFSVFLIYEKLLMTMRHLFSDALNKVYSAASLMALLASSSLHLSVQIQDILPFHGLQSLKFTTENLRCVCLPLIFLLVGQILLSWETIHHTSHLDRWRRSTHIAPNTLLVIGSEVLWWTQELASILLTWGRLQISEFINGPLPRHWKPFSLHHLHRLNHG